MPGYIPSAATRLIMGGTTYPLGTLSTGGLLRETAGTIGSIAGSAQGSAIAWDTTLGAFGDTIRAWAIGTTATTGISLDNTTAAAAGAQQYSPGMHFGGNGWKTDATAASQSVDWRIDNQPVQGSSAPTSYLRLMFSVNGGAYSQMAVFHSSGSLGLTAGLTCTAIVCSTYLYAGAANNGLCVAHNFGSAGLGTGAGLAAIGANCANAPLQLLHYSRPDSANNIVIASAYVPGATSITNAATMLIHSFGWTSSSGPTYTQLAGVYGNGRFVAKSLTADADLGGVASCVTFSNTVEGTAGAATGNYLVFYNGTTKLKLAILADS